MIVPPEKVLNKACLIKSRIANPFKRVFEEGSELKKKFGENEVCDFSLGNPVVPPPDCFAKALIDLAQNPPSDLHGYMPNQGRFDTRAALAKALSKWYDFPLEAKNLTLTVGTTSALVVLFHSILNPGDEVVVITPYFQEYNHYVSHAGGVIVRATSKADYDIDIDAIEKVITPKTRAILINSPNNPTGKIYTKESLQALSELLTHVYESRLATATAAKTDEATASPIFIVSDDVYRRINYLPTTAAATGCGDGLPSLLKIHPHSIICSSFSKDLSIAGERLGFIAVPPALFSDEFSAALAGNMREYGFVNAPSFMQFAIERVIDKEITCVPWYRERRDLLRQGLIDAGLDCPLPEGAFFLFARVPAGVTDVEFSDLLRAELVLSVPGSCFADPSGIRFAYCVSLETIRTAIPRVKKVMQALKAQTSK